MCGGVRGRNRRGRGDLLTCRELRPARGRMWEQPATPVGMKMMPTGELRG